MPVLILTLVKTYRLPVELVCQNALPAAFFIIIIIHLGHIMELLFKGAIFAVFLLEILFFFLFDLLSSFILLYFIYPYIWFL